MNNDYEKEFVNNVYQGVEKSGVGVGANQSKTKAKGSSNIAFIVAVVAIIGMILELIILLVVLLNMPKDDSDVSINENEIVYEYDWEGMDSSPAFLYDEKFQLKGFSLKCTLEGKGEYIFDKNGGFSKYGVSSELENSGEYEIVKSSAVVLKGKDGVEKVVYYNAISIIDGLDFYECEQSI